MPNQYKILEGDTLSQIALTNKTDIPTLQKLNPQITDPNLIIAGQSLNLPQAVSATDSVGPAPIVATSDLARNKFNENINNVLPKMESGFVSKPQTTEGFADYAKQKGFEINPQTKEVINPSPELIDEFNKKFITTSGAISIKSDNPAFQNIIDQTNEVIKKLQADGQPLPPEIQQKLNAINDFQAQKTSAVSEARTAADNKDAAKMDASLAKAKEADVAIKSEIETMRADLKTKQAEYIASLKPSEAETLLKQKLNTLRTERQLLPLELRKEGIPAAGIASRQIEDERVRAIQESNLLFEIGLEQEARQFKTLSAEKQLGFIRDDINLQMKIQDNLDQKEKDVLTEARDLRKDSLSAMSTILKSFEGLAWEDLDVESQAELIETTKQFNIPVNLLAKAMKNVKQQKVFDASKTGIDKLLSVDEAIKFGVPYGTTKKQVIGKVPMAISQLGRENAINELLSVDEATKFGVPFGTTKAEVVGKVPAAISQLGIEATKTRENAISGLGALKVVEEEINKDMKILLKAAVPGAIFARKFETARKEASDVITRLRTGAALNESEERFYKSQLPSILDYGNKEAINYKIELFRNLFERLQKSSPIQSFQSENNDPLGIR
mgnify:CR=1 FL=1